MMTLFAKRSRCIVLPVLAATVISFAGTTMAHADVKIVSKQTGGGGRPGGGAGPATQMLTTYYKGNKIRSEMGSNVVIIDGDANKMFVLNPQGKTYMERPLGLPSQATGMLAALDMKTDATVTPLGKTRVIAGKPTKGYAFKATVTMSMKPGAMPNAPKGGAPQKLGTFQITGEHWTTDAVKMPGTGSAMQSYVRMARAMSGNMPGMKNLFDKFSQIKGFPLASSQKVTTTGLMGGPPRGGGGASGPAFQMSTEAVSVSEAPLAASLFAVPAGYKQQQMSSPGMRPGGMRPGMPPPVLPPK